MLVKLNGQRIIEMRQALGLSRDAFVEVCGVSRASLHMIENDKLKLGCQLWLAQQIADALDVSLEAIWSAPPARQRRPDITSAT